MLYLKHCKLYLSTGSIADNAASPAGQSFQRKATILVDQETQKHREEEYLISPCEFFLLYRHFFSSARRI